MGMLGFTCVQPRQIQKRRRRGVFLCGRAERKHSDRKTRACRQVTGITPKWFVDRGSWIVIRGSWFVVRGSWFVNR
jgi:hypothetical protein